MSIDEEITELRQHHDKAAQKKQRSEWVAEARLCLVAYAAGRDTPFLIEEARRAAETSGLPAPPDARAWGYVVRMAAVSGEIEQCGSARAGSSNGSLKPLWRAIPSPTIWGRLKQWATRGTDCSGPR